MTTDQILELLDALQQRLDGPGKYIFDLAVRQVVTGAVLGLVIGVALLVGCGVAAIVGRRLYLAKKDDSYSDPLFGLALAAIAWCFIVLGAVVVTGLSLLSLLNPEYSALAGLLRTVTGKP